MSKTAITNDKPKEGATDKAVNLAVTIAYELGKQMGARGSEPEAKPVVNTERRTVGPFGFRVPSGQPAANRDQGFKLPAADRPGHVPPKAIEDDQVTNTAKPISKSLYRLPKAED